MPLRWVRCAALPRALCWCWEALRCAGACVHYDGVCVYCAVLALRCAGACAALCCCICAPVLARRLAALRWCVRELRWCPR